jgi:hypothetical protein
MLDKIPSDYAFLINTDSYAGNFERECCAFVTGVIGDCEVGEEDVQGDVDYSLVEDIVGQYPDDHGCHRPVTIKYTGGKGSANTVAILLDEEPTKEQREFMEKRALLFPDYMRDTARKYLATNLKVTSLEWIRIKRTYVEENI